MAKKTVTAWVLVSRHNSFVDVSATKRLANVLKDLFYPNVRIIKAKITWEDK